MPPKRRRRFQGLYYHSSPPKVLPMNGQISNENGRKRRDNDDFSVKLSTIRIWMHEKDIGKLTRILWAGQGQRLRQQASTNSKVKRFLTAVPYVMNSIKDVHQAVIDNNLETLQTKLEPPVPPALVTCRDANGLNLIHKAAGLGHATILEYLITTWPDGVHETDITGKTPLHWAASAKNNMRCYTLLTQAGCDEEAVDYKMKTPSFYRHKPHDIERAFLTYVPEAPRVSPDVPTDWEALSDDSGDGKKPDIKIPEMNGFSRHSNAESNENTSEAEMTEAVSGLEDEEMSKDDDDDGVAADDSEALIENAEEAAEATQDLEDPPAKEEEEPEQTEPEQIEPAEEEKEDEDEEKESPINNGDKEDEEEQKEETEEEPDKEEMDDKEAEEAQDEKLQTENETTTNPTKEAEAEHETESKDEKAEEEKNATTEQENKDNNAASKEKETESAIKADQENDKTETELKEDKKEENEEEGDSKTVGETLEVIKDEVKENVKYLANKVKNIFTKNEEEEDEKKNDENEKDNLNDENITHANKINGNKNEVDDKEQNITKEDDNKEEEKIKADGKEQKENMNSTEINKVGNNGNMEESTEEEIIKKENLNKTESQTETNKALDKNSNDINDQAQKLTNSIVNSLGSTTIETLKNENNKTEEDENNNKPKSIEVAETTNQKEPTDEDFEKINKSLEEYLDKEENNLKEKQQELGDKLEDIGDSVKVSINQKQQEMGKLADNITDSVKETQQELGDKLNEVTDSAKETKQELGNKLEEITDSVKETKQDLGDKLDEITDNVKESVKDMANKVKNIFSSSSEDKLDNESNDIVLHSESPTKKLKKPKVESESSDETADEDEATQAEEANDDDKNEPEANDADDEQAENDNPEDTETEDRNGEESPTSSLAIEGFVQGESEDNQVQSQTAAYVHDDEDTRLQNIIASGDMEQLAQIVLNGDGQKLLNVEATEPEIQAFLKNVPNYMTKIRRVHEAARGGSLLNLQQALDRRKFAIAKDEISPNGATPLHVAVLFGHSDIVRYLSARFPETTTIADNDDRTALHYAAVIKDNGHFYNVLLQLGANPKMVDKMGHSPEEYLGNETLKETLNYGQLLKNFGAEELETQLLSDQVPDDLHSSRRLLSDADVARTLERCFSVIQESSKIWSGQTASALAQKKPLSATNSLQLSITSYLSRFLKPSVYEKIKKRQTRLDHNLFDVIWPALRKTSKDRHLEEDINNGIIAPDFDVYVVFQEFLVPLIKDMHCMSVTADFKPHPRIAYFPMESGERLNTAYFVFDDEANLIVRCMIECSRNLEKFELPLNLTIGQIEQAERLMMAKIFTSDFIEAIDEAEPGSYYTLTEILEDNSEIYDMLSEYGLLIPLLDLKDATQLAESSAFNGNLWPYGRGVYISSSNNLAIWLNCQEHLRIIATSNSKDGSDIGAVYTRVGRAVSFLEQQLHLKESYLLGYLQSRPSYLGTGLKMTTILRLPNLMKEMDNLRHLCSVRGLHLTTNRFSKLSVRVINMQSLGAVEHVLFQDYCTAVTNILSLEKDMSLTNSKHIATMLVKIFRRKKTSLVDRD